jgi:O-antigen/teichoic acid export membrane protein
MNQKFSEEDIKKVARGAGTSLVGSSVGKGLFFLSQIIIARILGVEAFGLYALGLASVKICEIVARLGLNTGGMRFVSLYKDENIPKLKGVLISAMGLSLVNGAVIGSLLYFFSGAVAQNIFHKPELTDTLKLFALSIPFVSGMTVASSLLQGFHTAKFTVYMRDFIQPIANIFLIMCFFACGFNLEGVVWAFTLSHLFASMTGLLFFKKLFPQLVEKETKPIYELKTLVSYSTPLLFVGFLHYFLSWIDTLMLGLLGTTKEVGIYRAASQVPFIMTLFLAAMNSIYAPLAAGLYQIKEMQRLSSIFKTTTRWVTYVTVPIFIFLVFSSKEIMMLFGNGYVETGHMILIILSFGQLVNCMTGGVGYTLTMTGRQNLELANSIGLVLLSVALNIILIPRYGALGAAISSAISFALINLARLSEIYFMFKMIPFSQKMIKILAPVFISVLVLSIRQEDFSAIARILSNMVAVMIIFALSFYMMKMTDEDKYLISALKKKMLGKVVK